MYRPEEAVAIAGVNESIIRDPVVVLDLGAGWGRIGYVLKRVNPRATYIACDLPEALLISSTYLPRLLPDELVHGYEQNRPLDKFTKQALIAGDGMRFCGAQDLERFQPGSIDFLINVASFQEMTVDQVGAYFALIDKKLNGILYTQQVWQTPSVFNVVSGFDDYPWPSRWQRLFARHTTFSDRYFEAAFRVGPLPP